MLVEPCVPECVQLGQVLDQAKLVLDDEAQVGLRVDHRGLADDAAQVVDVQSGLLELVGDLAQSVQLAFDLLD